MKFKKKTAMLLSFTLGALLVGTTALADIANKSGYDRFKDSIKTTAAYVSNEADSYTMEMSMELKDNGQLLATANETTKYDRIAGASESLSTNEEFSQGKNSFYSYSDRNTAIYFNSREPNPTYYVTEFTKERKDQYMTNPFEDEQAEDLEKIADALVGNLKDYVIAEENPDGSLNLEGALSKVQIPALINAVTSYVVKQEFNGNQNELPRLTKDVYVKEIKGTATINEDGIMENIFGSAVLTGTDAQGTVHDLSVDILVKLSDLNATTVTKPDLTGKQVVSNTVEEDYSYSIEYEIANPEKFVGPFKNDIVVAKEGKFVKVGERMLVIEQFDGKTVAGRYYEEFKPEFAEYAGNKDDYTFTAQRYEERERHSSSNYEVTTETGVKGDIYFDEHSAKIYFHLNNSYGSGFTYDSTFSPDLE